MASQLPPKQRLIFDKVLHQIDNGQMHFFSWHLGGTGKLLYFLLVQVYKTKIFAITVASSGIAVMLFKSRCTAYSCVKIAPEFDEQGNTCNEEEQGYVVTVQAVSMG